MPVQRGFAMIAILALVALIAAFLISSALNRTAADVSNERENRSMSALRKAKAALIAYAANEQWQAGGLTPFQPGAFPCPDRDNDGKADDHQFPQRPCNTPLKRIGRFPWKTIGEDDLRDASGESLWYAVSAGFLQNTPLYTNIINSDTAGQLTVTGSISASNIVAIVFAPGEAIQGQVRSPANVNDPASYLEQFDSVAYATFTSTGLPSAINNDRLLVITQADLMATVEPIVAANIERDIKPYIVQNYLSANGWSGGYPFAVPWGGGPGQPQGDYKGDAATPTYRGLMPITRELNWVKWDTSSASVIQVGGTGSVTSTNCGTSTATQIVCVVDYTGNPGDRPHIQLTATLLYAGRSFVNAAVSADSSITDNFGAPISWSTTISPNPWTVSSALQVNGNGTVTFIGRLRNGASTNRPVTIGVAAPSYHAISNSADATSGWFIANQWYRQVFYAVSENGGVPGCNPRLSPPTPPTSPSCLRVNNLPPSYATPDDKRAILVFAGRELNGLTPRPANLANYLENANLTAANGTTPFVYEHRAGAPTSINDRVVVVAP